MTMILRIWTLTLESTISSALLAPKRKCFRGERLKCVPVISPQIQNHIPKYNWIKRMICYLISRLTWANDLSIWVRYCCDGTI
ncbi:hypothetical protein HanXRQr2_Chr13g0600941 [Helianthus annuus]|uniref:Secreted protein n=1 Tax=Helianthus annuus TaxID=4232 RepID=A0A9K3EIL1_HELAN|nr:hypothetical protein HanXRQr2_Chr13g0600941 [Helianthus annuus]KAJ0850289.1 hypothetical protein HanPSC8_Chr13g0578931 [Helianthus annuus]